MKVLVQVLCGLMVLSGWAQEELPVRGGIDRGEWKSFASVFRPEKPAIIRRELAAEQAANYIHYLVDPDQPAKLRRAANHHFHLEEFHEAARLYFRLLQQQPDNRELPAWFAESLYRAGSPQPALEVLEGVAKHGMDTPMTRFLRAELYYVTGVPDQARVLLEEVRRESEAHLDKPNTARMHELVVGNLRVLGM